MPKEPTVEKKIGNRYVAEIQTVPPPARKEVVKKVTAARERIKLPEA